jgi:hypothetical protein
LSWRQIMRCGSFSGRGTESDSRRRLTAAGMAALGDFGDT